MRVPSNQISVNYTTGNEYVDVKTNTFYQGYYYELNGKKYAGDSFNPKALEIIKQKEANQLFNNNATLTYSALSGVTSQSLKIPKISSLQAATRTSGIRFFARNLQYTGAILIKEIDQATYVSLQNNAFYQTTYIGGDQGLDTAEKIMPGLNLFLNG
jgi:hypothetical protein